MAILLIELVIPISSMTFKGMWGLVSIVFWVINTFFLYILYFEK